MLGQKKLFQRLVPGLIHAFIFWGFLVLFPTIVMALIGGRREGRDAARGSARRAGSRSSSTCSSMLVLVGVAAAFWIRKVQRPERFEGSHLGEADLILGADRADRDDAAALARGADRARAERVARRRGRRSRTPSRSLFGDGHLGRGARADLRLGARPARRSASSPTCRTRSTCTSRPPAINVWFGRTRARGRLEPLDFEVEDESAMRFGAGTVADMTWKQMIDTMSCTECGRCQDVCPAYATGKELSPKLLIMGLRDQLFAEGPSLLARAAAGVRADAARAERRQRRRRLGLRHVRRLRAASARSRSSTSTTSSTCAATS